jgi:hypothetical protein
MNVAEMKKNVKAVCHPITNIDAFITRMLDRGQKVIGSKHPFSWLRQYRQTLATVASQEFYALSPLVNTSKLIHIYDQTNVQHYSTLTEQEFRRHEPDPQNGEGYLYRFVGFSPVQNQPASAATVTMASSSAADTTQVVTLQGLDSSGIFFVEEQTISGLATVTFTNTCTKVFGLSKSAATAGTITVSKTIGATTTTMVAIAPSDRAVTHPVIGIFNIPDGVETLYYDYFMKLQTLSSDNHISLIPEQYHDAIEAYAEWKVFEHLNNPTMASLSRDQFNVRVQDMMQDDYTPSGVWTLNEYAVGGMVEAQLPSMFPRGG